jgi:DNA-binding response OmpR family regulator
MRTDLPAPRVLIVEDDPQVRHFLEDMSTLAGFAPDSVCEGRAAWAIISSMHSAYRLVFLDLRLPGWTGDDVLGLLGTLSCGRRFIVVISGYFEISLRRDFCEHPNVLCLLDKPFQTSEVAAVLQTAAREYYGLDVDLPSPAADGADI